MTSDGFETLAGELRQFVAERDWGQFHDPKSLILALVGEVGELAELFQWTPTDDAIAVFTSPDRRQRAAEELADVFIYLLHLGNVLGINVLEAAQEKLESTRARFPIETLRGVAPVKD